ncbi:hypothetical protein BGX34_002817 [Mortierella sp. NVP85]|nr:hypothetical protein BGX34_002817 [Mortierella sp. NVP85]
MSTGRSRNSSGGSTANSKLTQDQVLAMRTVFNENIDKFRGDIHLILKTFKEATDQEEIKRAMNEGLGLPALSTAESTFLKQYDMPPGSEQVPQNSRVG